MAHNRELRYPDNLGEAVALPSWTKHGMQGMAMRRRNDETRQRGGRQTGA